MYIYMYISMYIYMCIYMYIYTCTYTYICMYMHRYPAAHRSRGALGPSSALPHGAAELRIPQPPRAGADPTVGTGEGARPCAVCGRASSQPGEGALASGPSATREAATATGSPRAGGASAARQPATDADSRPQKCTSKGI